MATFAASERVNPKSRRTSPADSNYRLAAPHPGDQGASPGPGCWKHTQPWIGYNFDRPSRIPFRCAAIMWPHSWIRMTPK